jgi:hypothetical protein
MKNIVLLIISLTIVSGCSKNKEPYDDPLGDPLIAHWRLSFILADDDGNNLLPWNLPQNHVANPEDYHAYHEKNSEIGYFTRNPQYGHIFRVRDVLSSWRETSSFQEDSSFVFYTCFGAICDTIIVYPYFPKTGSSCRAKEVYWNGNYLGFYWNEDDNFSIVIGRDSSETLGCNIIPIPSSISHLF